MRTFKPERTPASRFSSVCLLYGDTWSRRGLRCVPCFLDSEQPGTARQRDTVSTAKQPLQRNVELPSPAITKAALHGPRQILTRLVRRNPCSQILHELYIIHAPVHHLSTSQQRPHSSPPPAVPEHSAPPCPPWGRQSFEALTQKHPIYVLLEVRVQLWAAETLGSGS